MTLHQVAVTVRTSFVPERSDPKKSLYFFAYNITITNNGTQPFQLLARHWIITDAMGNQKEVKGPGVVGKTPVIGVGESFNYASFCPLKTPAGSMRGSYQMVDSEGRSFEAEIPTVPLTRQELLN